MTDEEVTAAVRSGELDVHQLVRERDDLRAQLAAAEEALREMLDFVVKRNPEFHTGPAAVDRARRVLEETK